MTTGCNFLFDNFMNFSTLFSLKTKNIHPLLLLNNSYFKKFNQNRPIEEYDFVVFDTELTGLDSKRDEIISIGAVRIKNMQIMATETFQSYIRPQSLAPRKSTLIHQITPQQLEPAPALDKILLDFIDFCGPSLLVAHYVDMDTAFLNMATKKLFAGTLKNPCLDTMRLAHIYTTMQWEQYHDRFNLQISYNLGDLVDKYKLPVFNRHDALQDALQTSYLFVYLIKKMRHYGLSTLNDFFAAGKSWRNVF